MLIASSWVAWLGWGCSAPVGDVPTVSPSEAEVALVVHPDLEALPANVSTLVFRASTELSSSDGELVLGKRVLSMETMTWHSDRRGFSVRIEPDATSLSIRWTGLRTPVGDIVADGAREWGIVEPDLRGETVRRLRVDTWNDASMGHVSIRFPEAVHWDSLRALKVYLDGTPLTGDWRLTEGDTVAVFSSNQIHPRVNTVVHVAGPIADVSGNPLVGLPAEPVVALPAPLDE